MSTTVNHKRRCFCAYKLKWSLLNTVLKATTYEYRFIIYRHRHIVTLSMYKTLQYYIINITLYLAVYLINDSKMNATPVFII